MKNSKFIFGSDTPLPHEYPLNMLSEYLKSAANATSTNRLSRMRPNLLLQAACHQPHPATKDLDLLMLTAGQSPGRIRPAHGRPCAS